MKIFDRLIKILIVLLCGAIYLWTGIKWSLGTGAISGLAFDQGWLLVALLISQSIAIRLGGGKLGRRRWLRMILAALVGFALEGISDHLFLQLKQQPSITSAIEFAAFASLFLVYIVAWIIIFPYEELSSGVAASQGQSWRGRVRVMGIFIAIFSICGAGWCFHGAGRPILDTIGALQSWLYKASLLVYLFLAIRIFYPMFEMRLRPPSECS